MPGWELYIYKLAKIWIMGSFEEKLSILSQMIAFAQVDHSIKASEYGFLLEVASQLGVDRETFEGLLRERSKTVPLKSQGERIVQFHRLLLLMNIDREQHQKELDALFNIGLRMGLPPAAMSQVLEVMHHYPDKLVPADVLIDIFRAHYN